MKEITRVTTVEITEINTDENCFNSDWANAIGMNFWEVDNVTVAKQQDFVIDREAEEGVEEKVKPCPICGKSDKLQITSREEYEALAKEKDAHVAVIRCNRCGLEVYSHYTCQAHRYEPHINEAVQKWNSLGGRDE